MDRAPRGLSVLFVRYDRAKYPDAWTRFRRQLERLGEDSIETVVVDNGDTSTEPSEEDGVHRLAGSNDAWEFSAFDEGVAWLRRQGRLRDLVLLVTDAYGAYGSDFLGLVDDALLKVCRRHGIAAGWFDSFDEACELLGESYGSWMRTSCLLLPSEVLADIEPFAWPLSEEEIFDADWRRRWAPGAPVSAGLRRRIDHWLTGNGAGASLADADTWHSRFEVDADSITLFKAKALAILREHHLSIRLRKAGVPRADLRVLADHVTRSGWSGLEATDLGFEGLMALRERAAAVGPGPTPGRRLVFVGNLDRAEDLAAARRFSGEVMPLILQRFPTATFELPVSDAELPLGVTAGVHNTIPLRSAPVAASAPDPFTVRVTVGGAGTEVIEDDSQANDSKLVEMGASGLGRGSAGASAVALARRCCAALEEVATAVEHEVDYGSAESGGSGLAPEDFTTVAHRWRGEYRRWRDAREEEFEQREEHERSLVEGPNPFVVPGLCCYCERETPLHVDFEFGGDAAARRPNWRERLVCQVCGLNSKMRGLLHVLKEVVVPGPKPRLLVWALDDLLESALSARFTEVTGVAGDTGLPRPSRSGFDCLLVLDQFEREEDFEAAAERSLDLLVPGGGMVFTAAFSSDRESVREIADAAPGEVRRLFGWSMLQSLVAIGFEDVVAHSFWSRAFGYLGREQLVFVARKAQAPR